MRYYFIHKKNVSKYGFPQGWRKSDKNKIMSLLFVSHNCDHELEFQNSGQRYVDMFGILFYLRARKFFEVRES